MPLLPDLLPVLLIGAVSTIDRSPRGGFVVADAARPGLRRPANASVRACSRAITTVYVEVFRAVPVLTQLFIIYFGLGRAWRPLQSADRAAILGFGINGGAYLTEVFRAGIEAIHQRPDGSRALPSA